MTRLMEQAIERLRAIPEGQQDQLAEFLLNELDDDQRWLQSTSVHSEKLNTLVSKVLADDASGNSVALDPDHL